MHHQIGPFTTVNICQHSPIHQAVFRTDRPHLPDESIWGRGKICNKTIHQNQQFLVGLPHCPTLNDCHPKNIVDILRIPTSNNVIDFGLLLRYYPYFPIKVWNVWGWVFHMFPICLFFTCCPYFSTSLPIENKSDWVTHHFCPCFLCFYPSNTTKNKYGPPFSPSWSPWISRNTKK